MSEVIPQKQVRCKWEQCDALAVAFLRRVRTYGSGRKEVIEDEGYCQEHAVKMHERLKGEQYYKEDSFDTPDKLV